MGADPVFLQKHLCLQEFKVDEWCRECKAFLLLERRVEVDKYSYNGWFFNRSKKFLKLSDDRQEFSFWSKHRSRHFQVAVPISDILGVVFGAYTCTFKKQRHVDQPPHWSAFSLIGRTRTYDFSAHDPQIVECCVRTLQQVIWDKRTALNL